MQMTEAEYEELMAHFYFLGDKIDPVYKRETDMVIERLKEEYKQHVKKWCQAREARFASSLFFAYQ